MSLLADGILYIENPEDSTLTLITNKFSKVAGYKVNIQKSVVFLYLIMNYQKEKSRGKNPFIIASKGIKYLRINFTKEMKNLHTQN